MCVVLPKFISPNEGVWPCQCFPLHTYGIITHVQCSYCISRNFGGTDIWHLSNNCIWWYINLAKFKVLLYNLKCGYVIGGILIWRHHKIAKSPNFNSNQNFYSNGSYIK